MVAEQDGRQQDWLDGFYASCDVASVRNHTYDSTRDSCDEDRLCSVIMFSMECERLIRTEPTAIIDSAASRERS